MSSSRKKYAPEYRQDAARLATESGRPIAYVAKEIGVAEGLWVNGSSLNENVKARMMAAVTQIYELKTLVCAVSWLRSRW